MSSVLDGEKRISPNTCERTFPKTSTRKSSLPSSKRMWCCTRPRGAVPGEADAAFIVRTCSPPKGCSMLANKVVARDSFSCRHQAFTTANKTNLF